MASKTPFLPTSSRTHPHIGSKKTFLQTAGSDHRAHRLDRLAKAQGCDIGRIGRLQADLYHWCSCNADGGDGRLPYDDSRALSDLAAVDDLGDAEKLLRHALEAGFVVRRWGHLYMPAFKRAFPIPHVHARAKVARAERDRDELQHRARGYQRAYAARRKADLRDWQQANRLPSGAPGQPLCLVAPPKPTRGYPQIDLSNISARSQQCPPESSGGQAELPAGPSSSQIDLSKISAPPADAFYGGLRAYISKSSRLNSAVVPPAFPVHECEPPAFTAVAADREAEGGEHVRQGFKAAHQPSRLTSNVRLGEPPDCAEGKGASDAGSPSHSPKPLVAPAQTMLTVGPNDHLSPHDFACRTRAMFACGALSADIAAEFEAQLGADWVLVVMLLGKNVPQGFNKLSPGDRQWSLHFLHKKHVIAHEGRQGAKPAPRSSGEELLAALGVAKPQVAPPQPQQQLHEPGADQPVATSQAADEPSSDSLSAIIKRVAGHRASEVYAGPDLARRIEALKIGPERTELAFKAAAQNPPARYSRLGWAALTRLERLAGVRAPLGDHGGGS